MIKNINHKLLVCGDIHLQDKNPKHDSAIETLNWIFNNEKINNENNSILFLGDICEINSSPELYEIYVDLFTNRSLFQQIYLLQGNHDCYNANQSTILSIFRPLPRVEVITDWKIIDFYNTKILALPFYHHEGIASKEPMTECYSNLYKNELIKNTEIDYCCGHIEDETNHFSKKFCDLSKLNVKHFLHGHIHTPTIQNGGHYLGSATLNSVTENNDTKYLAIIDGETKKYELQEIPRFLSYYTVEYPNKLEKPKTPYAIFTIKNALDKQTVLTEYGKQAEQLGFKFYTNKILKQKVAEVETDNVEQTEKPTFEKFAKSVELSDEISDICREVIRLKSEE